MGLVPVHIERRFQLLAQCFDLGALLQQRAPQRVHLGPQQVAVLQAGAHLRSVRAAQSACVHVHTQELESLAGPSVQPDQAHLAQLAQLVGHLQAQHADLIHAVPAHAQLFPHHTAGMHAQALLQ